MAQATEATAGARGRPDKERPDKGGHVGLLLLFTGSLVGIFALLVVLPGDLAQPLLIAVLALLAMTGVFFVFALAVGAVRVGRDGRSATDVVRAVSDEAPEGLVLVSDGGRVLYANDRYAALSDALGLPDPEPAERILRGGPEVAEAVYRLSQAAREGRTASEELRLSPSLGDGRVFGWYRVRVRKVGRGGKRSATLWSIADVTQDRERQESVFQELQHAIDYLDHAPAGFFSSDRNGAVVYVNATLASWLGYDLTEVGSGGLALADILPDAAASLLAGLDGMPSATRTETLDVDLVRRDGRPFPARLRHRVEFETDGLPSPSRTLVLDKADPAGEAIEGPLTAEVRFSRFFNSTPLAVATFDRRRQVVRSNPAFRDLFGTVRVGSEVPFTNKLPEEDRPRLEAAFAGTESGERDGSPVDVTVGQGSAARQARMWISRMDDADPREGGERLILYVLDTTEQRQLEGQLAQAQKMQAVGQLAGGVAHDFNNVLQAIIGYSDLLLASHRPTDSSFQDIMQIKQNANRAAGLVRQLLAFSRRQTLRPEVVQLGETFSDLSLLLKRLLGERVQLELHQARDLWFIKADVNQLEQVVINLAVNARDAMPDGGTVSIATANVDARDAKRLDLPGMPTADFVRIDVGDTGTGIPPDIMDKIFEPFFTTKELGKGTGLGLSTVFGIVKQSGGYIYVDSRVGGGTTFSIYLPRHVPEPAEAPKDEPASPKARAADMTGQGTILLVEDEDAVRAVNSRALTARGYTVLQASSGMEAIELLEGHAGEIELVVSDVVMPEMDGPTLLGELRKRRHDIRFVFVSGYAEDAFAKHLPDGETFTFLPKPFSLKQLVETVKQAIGS